MFDLVAEVSAHERQHPPGPEVRGTQHLPEIPFRLCLTVQHRLVELLCSVSEVTADNHDVRPRTAQPVGHHVGRECSPPPPATQRRKEDIVFADLPNYLADQRCFMDGLSGVCCLTILHGIQAVHCNAPFEGGRQQYRIQGLRQGARPPRLVPSDPQDSESEVVVHVDDVREDVVPIVVGISPL